MFDKKLVEQFLEKTNDNLDSSVTIYMIGGCNLSLRNMKGATKDIDLVLLKRTELAALKSGLEKLNYSVDKELFKEAVYQQAVIVFKDDTGSRVDIFIKIICNQLELSNSMVKRSQLYKDYGKLKVMLVAPEDILLFKSLTGRPQDIEDSYVLIQRGINWKTVIEECVSQHRKDVRWIFWLYEHLCMMEDSKSFLISEKSRVFDICIDNWEKKPSDWMYAFSDEQIKRHIPMSKQKEILKVKEKEFKE